MVHDIPTFLFPVMLRNDQVDAAQALQKLFAGLIIEMCSLTFQIIEFI